MKRLFSALALVLLVASVAFAGGSQKIVLRQPATTTSSIIPASAKGMISTSVEDSIKLGADTTTGYDVATYLGTATTKATFTYAGTDSYSVRVQLSANNGANWFSVGSIPETVGTAGYDSLAGVGITLLKSSTHFRFILTGVRACRAYIKAVVE